MTYPLTAEPRFQHQSSNSKMDRLSWDTAGLKMCVTKSYNQHTYLLFFKCFRNSLFSTSKLSNQKIHNIDVMGGKKKVSQDIVLFDSTTLLHYPMDKRIMEIYIPLTISNREFSKFPVVFFLDALPAFYIYIQILFLSTCHFSRISESLSSQC